MADCKKYEDCGTLLLNQGGWQVINNYVQFTGDYKYQERICTINYVPNFHPNTITITGIANKELEISVLVLKNNNYVIAEIGWCENGHTFDIGNDYDKLGVAFRYADGSNIALNDVTIEEVGAWQHSLRKLTTTGWHDSTVEEWDGSQWG